MRAAVGALSVRYIVAVVNQELIDGDRRRVDGITVCIRGGESLGKDVVVVAAPAAVITVAIAPRNDKAVAERRYRRLGLGIALPGVNPELVALLRTRIIEALGVDVL